MRLPAILLSLAVLTGVLAVYPVFSQTQLVSDSFFPAALEFKELKAIRAERDLKDLAGLARLEHAPVLFEAGIKHYADRTYTLADRGSLSIEVMTFADARGAYSMLTLLGRAGVHAGPPGNYFRSDADTLVFDLGNYCVRIRSSVAGDLSRRVAISVANRIGDRAPNPPNLIKHFPEQGCDLSSIRYILGPQALASFGTPVAGATLKIPSDVEVAQAECTAREQAGTLTLLSFPTILLAEEYFSSGTVSGRGTPGGANLYTRQTGPLVSILEGNFTPEAADKILGTIKFSYSIKWIFDRNSQQNRTIWGVPVRILGTVVRSILFTVLLCVISIVAGIVLAAGRMFVRRRWAPAADGPFIRLKINED
jgi:hypothetical protein